jgi:hypothetical protein
VEKLGAFGREERFLLVDVGKVRAETGQGWLLGFWPKQLDKGWCHLLRGSQEKKAGLPSLSANKQPRTEAWTI